MLLVSKHLMKLSKIWCFLSFFCEKKHHVCVFRAFLEVLVLWQIGQVFASHKLLLQFLLNKLKLYLVLFNFKFKARLRGGGLSQVFFVTLQKWLFAMEVRKKSWWNSIKVCSCKTMLKVRKEFKFSKSSHKILMSPPSFI